MIIKRDHRTVSLADQIFEQLEKDILSGKYQRGEIINEQRLAAELNVSRTPIREAMSRLIQEHIIADTPKGIVIVGISREDMLDMYEIRTKLEGAAAARAAENITADQLREMGETLTLQKYYIDTEIADGSDYSDIIKDLDSRFHELLYLSTDSKAYIDILVPLHKKMVKFRKASVRNKGRAAESVKEHFAIYHALQNHDPALAEKLVIEHTGNACRSIKNITEV